MLFRTEVFEARKRRLWGEVRLAQPPSLRVWTGVMTAIGVTLVACLATGSYTRKETVAGYLTPEGGVIQITAPRTGRVTRLLAREGDNVAVDAMVVDLADQTVGTEVGQVLTAQMAQLQDRISSERLRRSTELEGAAVEVTALRERIVSQRASMQLLEGRLAQQRAAIDITSRQVASYQALVDRGYGAQYRMDELQKQLLAYQGERTNSERELEASRAEIADLNGRIRNLELRSQGLGASADGALSELEQRYIEVSSSSQFAVRAPVAGVISNSQVEVGQTVAAGQPLMSVMPGGAHLQAELLLPSKAAGFVEQGDEVRLRVDAFPSQTFGAVAGRVLSISRSVVRPGDYLAPIEFDQAMYRVKVSLEADHVMAYGRRQALRPGMSLSADIVTDRRPLWRQLFDPLLAARQRLE